MMLNLDEQAGIAAALGVLAAGAWKIYLRLKQDKRDDLSKGRQAAAESSQFDYYDDIIKNLREEVERLAKSVGNLSTELEKERLARFAAESLAYDLKRKVESLEREVSTLKGLAT